MQQLELFEGVKNKRKQLLMTIDSVGDTLVSVFHRLALFAIGTAKIGRAHV